MIVARQSGDSWVKSVVKRLAADLQAEFPGVRGFSAQNLWYMRRFYLAYHGHGKLQPLVGETNPTFYFLAFGDRFLLSGQLVMYSPTSDGLIGGSLLAVLDEQLLDGLCTNAGKKTINAEDWDEMSYAKFSAWDRDHGRRDRRGACRTLRFQR